MFVNNNELFDALTACDILIDESEQRNCWIGVFMENVITDFKDHTTKYLKTEDLMYPCSAVQKIYKRACYSFQSSYALKVTKSFDKTFAECRKIPNEYQDVCFESVGRDAVLTADRNITEIKEICLSFSKEYEEKIGCVVGAAKTLIYYYHSDMESRTFCLSLPEELQSECFSSSAAYYRQFHTPI